MLDASYGSGWLRHGRQNRKWYGRNVSEKKNSILKTIWKKRVKRKEKNGIQSLDILTTLELCFVELAGRKNAVKSDDETLNRVFPMDKVLSAIRKTGEASETDEHPAEEWQHLQWSLCVTLQPTAQKCGPCMPGEMRKRHKAENKTRKKKGWGEGKTSVERWGKFGFARCSPPPPPFCNPVLLPCSLSKVRVTYAGISSFPSPSCSPSTPRRWELPWLQKCSRLRNNLEGRVGT